MPHILSTGKKVICEWSGWSWFNKAKVKSISPILGLLKEVCSGLKGPKSFILVCLISHREEA